MIVTVGLEVLAAVVALAALVLGTATFVAFVDEDRAGAKLARDARSARLTLQVGAVTFVVGLAVTYVLARLDSAWAVVTVPVLAIGIALLVKGELSRHRSSSLLF